MRLRRVGNRSWWAGVVAGVALVLLGRVAINKSTFPDLLIAPLLVPDSPARGDAIVVLGAGVIGECIPNLNGVRRAMLGARLFKEGRAPLLVITGGTQGAHCPVADAMAQLPRELGVPADRIVLERQSLDTRENGERTAPLLRERRVSRIVLVTDRLHMRRAAGVFQQLGFLVEPSSVPIYEGHVDNVSMLTTGVREAAALAYYRLRGWTGEPQIRRTADGAAQEGVRQPMASDRRPVVILGASYAAGWKLAAVDGIPVVNKGVAGQQSFELLARFDADVVALRPQAVIIWGFINDIFRATDMTRARAQVPESFAAMTVRARAHGIEPILATEVTIRPPKGFTETAMGMVGWLLGRQAYQDRVNEHVMAGNRAIRDLARREDLLLLEVQAALAAADGRRRYEFAQEDGSHISAAGYDALTEYARPMLASHLLSKSGAQP